MLIDDLGRKHTYLRISLTERCNLRCSYCIPYDLPYGYYSNSVRMSAQEIDAIVSEFVALGIKKIRLTGGEPLVRKEAKQIIQTIAKYPVELAITSNGILIDEFTGTFLKAGIHSVNISLDSLQADKFLSITKRDNFEKVLSNIHLLLLNNFFVKINMVVMKNVNHDEIADFVGWTKYLPLHIRFIEFMPFSGNRWDKEKVFPCPDILRLIETKYDFIRLKDEKNSTAKTYRVIGYEGSFGIISTMSEPFCENCNRLRLTADGKLKNCLFSKTETDLLTPLHEGKDIRQIIIDCIKTKEQKQGGQVNSHLPLMDYRKIKNRSMVSIGG